MQNIKNYKNLILGVIFFVAIIVVDLITKDLVASNMQVFQTIPIIQDVFHITYVQNTGAAFSIMENQMLFFYIITPIAFVGGSIFFYFERKKSTLQNISLIMMGAGTIGNFIDRIAFKYVRDMFDFRLINFAVFNVADIALTVGVGLFILYLLLDLIKDIKKKENE